MNAISNTRPGARPKAGWIRAIAAYLARWLHNLSVAEKIYGIVAVLFIVTPLLLIMSVQTVRLQTAYRHLLGTSATAAINLERVNGLIYAIVMESRGVYMSTERAKVKQFSDELLKRNRELADVMAGWEETVRFDDAEQFSDFKKRIIQFIEFRRELVRRALEISPAAGREWGDNDANRSLRTQLNVDIEALAKIYAERTRDVSELHDQSQNASWYLFGLGLAALMLATLIVFVMKRNVIGPLSRITEATDLIAAGKIELDIPFVDRRDEIGHLARAVRNFRDAASRNRQLEQLEIGTAKQRDTAREERDKLNDKYLETKWQLYAALDNMAQGLVMMDSKSKILMTNRRFRAIYQLPPELFGPNTTLRDLLTYRAERGLFVGDIDQRITSLLDRIAKGKPSITENSLADGRSIRVTEQPMAGGGWVATHEDFTEQRRAERILAGTERFLVTIVENVSEAIIAKDARSSRYTFVNRAAEKLLGLPRSQIIGKSVRDLFPAETVELIESKDRELLAGKLEDEVIVRNIYTPNNGEREVAVRRLRVAGEDGQSHIFLSMIEDLTDRANAEGAAA